MIDANRNRTFLPFGGNGVNAGRIRRSCCVAVTGLAMFWVAGCGGAPEPAPPQPSEPAKIEPAEPEQPVVEPSAPTQPTPEPSPVVQPGGDNLQDSPGPEPQTQEPEKPVEEVALPKNVAEWKEEHFVGAKRQNDPLLIEAIQHLGTRHIGDPSVVPVLATVLKPVEIKIKKESAPEQPGSGGFSGGSENVFGAPASTGLSLESAPTTTGETPQLGRQVALSATRALILNNTDPARKVLREIVSGELQTDDDRAAVPPAMKAIFQQPTPENEAFLFQILIEPEEVRKSATTPSTSEPGMNELSGGMLGVAGGGQSSQPVSTEEFHRHAIQLTQTLGSESFRAKLAQYLLGKAATATQREKLVPLLGQQRPENAGAQLLFYTNPASPAEFRTTFEKYFVQFSSVALGHVLGILADKEPEVKETSSEEPKKSGWGGVSLGADDSGWGDSSSGESFEGSAGMGGGVSLGTGGGLGIAGSPGGLGQGGLMGANAPDIDLDNPEVIYPLAQKIWDSKTADTVSQRTQQISSLEEPNTTLALARTMPVDKVRAGLYKLLRSRFDDGPGQFQGESRSGEGMFGGGGGGGGIDLSSGAGAQLGAGGGIAFDNSGGGHGGASSAGDFFDPGFLLVVKMLPREEKPQRPTARKRSSRPQPSGAETGLGIEEAAAGSSEATPAEQWMQASQNVLEQLCEQCQKAAKEQPADKVAPGKIRVKPHHGAQIVARYDLCLPDDAAEKLGGSKLDPIELHYVRIEETTQFSRLTKYYRRVTKVKHRTIGRNDAWFDSVKDASSPGRKLSCDVLITRPQGAGGMGNEFGAVRGRQKEPPEPLVVQILTIEMKDPTGG
ncbi:MAG: hypothetical protein JW888_02205 [Pirellulales bacterium]|nr:hypothetical protein [Pirellulales bacterium]